MYFQPNFQLRDSPKMSAATAMLPQMKGCVSEGSLSGKKQCYLHLWLKYLTSAHFTETYGHANRFLKSPLRALEWAYVNEKSFSWSLISFIVSILMNSPTVFSHIFPHFSQFFTLSSHTVFLDFSVILWIGKVYHLMYLQRLVKYLSQR